MSTEKDGGELADLFLQHADQFSSPEVINRDAACLLLDELDYEAQLIAIRHLLNRNLAADQALNEEMRELKDYARKTSGVRNEQVTDEYGELFEAMVYQDAAHSMAAVGMLAPMVETIFYQAFQNMRHRFVGEHRSLGIHTRWQVPAEDQWDCRFVWNNGKRSGNLVEGIVQMAAATGFAPYLPADLKQTLTALFEYRNKMFHYGFEWPPEERNRFEQRIVEAKWPSDWFSRATKGHRAWIFYLTDHFTKHCLETISQILDGLGTFVRKILPAKVIPLEE